ncbi:hypothetical protein F0562_016689 [Nyssa sinensis]|uniref:non-specific serine/threonine protein kinase n=1 Tax=Nyssa sinensis TaxID=561372 RepID=A0A5J4ZFA3_9ASTE|nr:hypothetical protein F0562_016689 [Nyssa sinensis]
MPNASLDKDVALGLIYLHEEWVELIIHRDIKASNVLLDGECNGKLGDFGLARCIDHGKDPQTTQVEGTLDYIAAELPRNGKATTRTYVFAFGAFCLEVACSRRPVEQRAMPEETLAEVRSSMSQVLQYLKGYATIPENLEDLLWTQDHEKRQNDFFTSDQSASKMKDSKPSAVSSDPNGFIFYEKLKQIGVAEITPDGLLERINKTTWASGYTFYSLPFSFKNSSNGNVLSFSTMFVFEIVPEIQNRHGFGMQFVFTRTKEIPEHINSQNLNQTNNGRYNHSVAIKLDTSQEELFNDINDNHVDIYIESIKPVKFATAGYYANENGEFKNITLTSGEPIKAWVDYDGMEKQLNVTLSPININKPNLPLLSSKIDLSPVILNQTYVGFSSSVGANVQSHYILGWSFQLNGKAQELDLSRLPSPPRKNQSKKKQLILIIGLPVIGVLSASTTVLIIVFLLRRKAKFTEILEDWEVQYGPHRFHYKDLFVATRGFKENELLGRGGFGQVYRGVIPVSNTQVAVKRISHESKQGMKEFVAEIATIGRLRHPSLSETTLNWNQRSKIIKDVASGLAYLHEEWVEVIIHRDIKASNVLLDGELNGKLGDFGLARRCNHGKDPQTTHLAGTLGYIAPELARNDKATTSTDVFAFGAFLLEVACGRKPVERQAAPEEVILVDWVAECLRKGEILKTVDHKLKNDYRVEDMELVLKLGLLCSHPGASVGPKMPQVLQYLKGHASLPENLDDLLLNQEQWGGPD